MSVPARPQRQVQRRVTAELLDGLASGYLSGLEMQELAELFGLHRTTVARQLKQLGVPLRGQSLTPEQIRDVVRLYAQGHAMRRIAERLGCDYETVRRALKAEGVERRKAWERS